MKAYICKDDIKKNFHDDLEHLYGWGWSLTDIDKIIDSTCTVTEADLVKEVLDNIELGITSTGHSDQYTTGFSNALIWLRSCITGEEPKYLEDLADIVKMKLN